MSTQTLTERCRTIAESSRFQRFILVTIIIAGILVGIQTYGDRVASYSGLLNFADAIILAIFTVEVVVKVLAEAPKYLRYFKDSWNVFDFTIVAIALIALFLPDLNAGFIAVLRLVRILRVFKLVTAIPKLQVLVGALLKSIPSMGYIGILLSLLFYIYAAMAVFLFGENDPVHFGDLQTSMLSLFRVVTLEDWTDIMYINMHGCDHPISGYGVESGCVAPQGFGVVGALFFVSFVLIGTMVVLNLFIGVIMTSMDEARDEAEEDAQHAADVDRGNTAPTEASASDAALIAQLEELTKVIDSMKSQLATSKSS